MSFAPTPLPSAAPPSVDNNPHHSQVEQSAFVQEAAAKTLRICCYGSSSPRTPAAYLDEAWAVGYVLARRGHINVNGAGAAGCMGALNDGGSHGKGHIVGVIHEMFVVDGTDWLQTEMRRSNSSKNMRRANSLSNNIKKSKPATDMGLGAHKGLSKEVDGVHRELLVAGGDDLQERKKLLVKGADAIIVLPGGPGTWDELWEMVCARNLGMSSLPIVLVSVDGYYDPFQQMLVRAYQDGLIKTTPDDLVHFSATAQDAVQWVEEELRHSNHKKPHLKRRTRPVLHGFMSTVATVYRAVGLTPETAIPPSIFIVGLAIGVAAGAAMTSRAMQVKK